MRLIDAEGSELQTQLKIIREAEYQIYGSGSWGFTAKCERAIEDAPTIQPEPCEDAVSREALINKLEQWQKQDGYDNGEWNLLIDVITEIKNMPLATDINVGDKDTISRQAAIDALDEYFVRIGELKRRGLNKGEKAISLDTVGVIKTLPSAQPEIVRCKDCKYWREDHTCKEHSLVSPMLANDFCSRAERRTDD